MALGADIARGRIIGHQIAAEVVVGELDFGIAAQRVDLARLLAFLRINDDRMLFTDGDFWFPRALRGSAGALVWLGRARRRDLPHCRRGRDDRMTIAGAFPRRSVLVRPRWRGSRRRGGSSLFHLRAGILR